MEFLNCYNCKSNNIEIVKTEDVLYQDWISGFQETITKLTIKCLECGYEFEEIL